MFAIALPSRDDLLDLCLPARHQFVIRRQRRATNDDRIRAVARVLALLTAGWIAVDAVTFDRDIWLPLAAERLLTAAILAIVSIGALHERSGPLVEVRGIGVLLIILGFVLISRNTLWASQADLSSLAAVSAYVEAPFLIASGIALFPLAAFEAFVVALLILAATILGAVLCPTSTAHDPFNIGSLWLLSTICMVASIGATLQLRSLITVTRQSYRDGLTGLLRRDVGEDILAAQFAIAERTGQKLAVAFLDLDKFKSVNDGFGHEAGDSVLEVAAMAIREATRDQDMAIRWGGEEFVIVLPNTTIDGALNMIERLGRHGLGHRPDGVPVTASVGLAERGADGAANSAALVAIADQRVYAAKSAGRNRIDFGGAAPSAFSSAIAATASR